MQEETLNELFDSLYDSLPRRQRGFVQEQINVSNGSIFAMAFTASFCSELVNDNSTTVFLWGSFAQNPTDDNDAEHILSEYKNGFLPDGQVDGSFFLIIHDKNTDSLLVTRSMDGSCPLYWGKSQISDALLFASDIELIQKHCISIEEFPAGGVFLSGGCTTEGTITTIGAKSLMSPHLCRIESSNNFVGESTVQ